MKFVIWILGILLLSVLCNIIFPMPWSSIAGGLSGGTWSFFCSHFLWVKIDERKKKDKEGEQ